MVASSINVLIHELVPVPVTGGKNEIIRGTYIHRDLAPSLAMWCSKDFGFKVTKIINA